MENIKTKKKVGRPKGTIKENKKNEFYVFNLRVDKAEKELIELGLKKMGIDLTIRGNKKKFFMNLLKFYLLKK